MAPQELSALRRRTPALSDLARQANAGTCKDPQDMFWDHRAVWITNPLKSMSP
jgi:hypothetical protein